MNRGLDAGVLALVAAALVVWSLLSGRLERLFISAPIAFVVMGLAMTHGPIATVHFSPHAETIRSLAEVTLALVLFTDASRVNVHELRSDLGLPVRLLAIGLPLTIGAGTALAFGVVPGISLWIAATIGAIVAPTDAALGASIMCDARVPNRIRRVLNVESGLNDGIATPFVNLFLAGALSSQVMHTGSATGAARELAVGTAIGAAFGLGGAWLLLLALGRGWSSPPARILAAPGLALCAYGAAVAVEANGFVAAFIAGMAFGSVLRKQAEPLAEFAEQTGSLFSLLVWLIFGAAMLVPGIERATWQDLVFAVLALTIVRMVPVAIALLGSGLDRATVAFVGWFGPRGLASVVFALIAYDTLDRDAGSHVLSVVTITVGLSVLAHGLTATPLAARYGAFAARLARTGPEHRETPPMRLRTGVSGPETGRTRDV